MTTDRERIAPAEISVEGSPSVDGVSIDRRASAITGLVPAISELRLGHLEPEATALRKQVQNIDILTVAVFGNFKAGKSSLLNQLAQRDVLPVGVVPVTAVITRLRFGATERAKVTFLNGSEREIALEEVKGYVAEGENPENEKQAATVEIELPSLRDLAPLEFVDTPGLGSALAHNTDATLRWLPNVSVALMAVSSETPLSERDLSTLRELRRHTPKTVLLLTKADLVNGDGQRDIDRFVREQLRKAGEEKLPVYFYSTRSESYRSEFERNVLRPLLKRRAETSRQILQHKFVLLANRVLDHARVAVAAATQAESNRQSLCDRLGQERREFGLLQNELRTRSKEWSGEFFEWTLNKLQPAEEALRSRMLGELNEQLKGWHLRLPRLLAAWRGWLQEFLQRELSELSRQESAMFQTPLRNVQAHLERALEAFHGRLAKHVQAALGIELTPRKFVLEVREPAVPPVDVSFAFDAAFSIVAALIPLFLVRPLIERSLLLKARDQLAKNISRLASTWRDRVDVEIRALVHSAERQAAEELDGLEQAAARNRTDEPKLRRVIAQIESWRGTFISSDKGNL
jgi:GTP-binding protein EngB required for normal cell division